MVTFVGPVAVTSLSKGIVMLPSSQQPRQNQASCFHLFPVFVVTGWWLELFTERDKQQWRFLAQRNIYLSGFDCTGRTCYWDQFIVGFRLIGFVDVKVISYYSSMFSLFYHWIYTQWMMNILQMYYNKYIIHILQSQEVSNRSNILC